MNQTVVRDLETDSYEAGVMAERERILTQWQYEMTRCNCEDAMAHMERRIKAELPARKEKK
jgi:hypothetical protein